MSHVPDIASHFQKNARKLTGQRQAILNLLQTQPHPLTPREIQARLTQGDCNLATIYRAMHLLKEMGLIHRYDFGDGIARYELAGMDCSSHHHHLICTQCATIVEINTCFPPEWEAKIAQEHGFRKITHKLEFFGLCPACTRCPKHDGKREFEEKGD
jgi:Fur family transcriptional regulator, ferric uptake regulator